MPSIDFIETALSLKRSGRFVEALRALQGGTTTHSRAASKQVLEIQLLERVGRLQLAASLADAMMRSRSFSTAQHASCEYVLGRIASETGHTDAALAHLRRAQALAKASDDLEQLCWAQMATLLIVTERSGPDAGSGVLADLRTNTTKLGNPQTLAAVHVFVGEMEAKYGRLRSAVRHAQVAGRFLSTSENVWLSALAENLQLAVFVLSGDVATGLEHASRALEYAEESGAAATIRACLGNIGNLHYLRGDSDRAVNCFERALRTLPSDGEKNNAIIETLARIRLDQSQLDSCAELLNQIESSIQTDADRALSAHRYAQLTRANLARAQGQSVEALRTVEQAAHFADVTGDRILRCKALILKSELLAQNGRRVDAARTLNAAMDSMYLEAPQLFADYERALAYCLSQSNDAAAARLHYSRARRLYEALANTHALNGLTFAFDRSLAANSVEPERHSQSAIQTSASIFRHIGQPELIAREVVDLLASTDAVDAVTAIARAADGTAETLAHSGAAADAFAGENEQHLAVGTTRGRAVEVVVHPKSNLESLATVNAVAVLLSTIHELERARTDREERATLWPVDELPSEDGSAITVGHMREMMGFARRVATANVAVLITGESGTGKEIIARAIHAHSPRAAKPFIPFNCTAVPRDMLDSQLFGHRRGAFTGAERDNPGVIRSARDGTLFLDEIGELGLDLQPKLLRFLESGEICPLGESTPFAVNVRVIAATNMNLEAAVRDARFREDLFYRLNVIRLTLKPLRERRDEIPTLVNHFLMLATEELRKTDLRIAEETIERLVLYSWPGNVRQLQNEIRRMVALAESNTTLDPKALTPAILRETDAARSLRSPGGHGREVAVSLNGPLETTLSRIEREMIKVALHEHHGRLEAAARALGISRKGLYLKRQRLGL